MIYLLTGNDKYRKDAKLSEIKKACEISDDGMNLSILESPEPKLLESELLTVPFLGPKRLIIVENMLSVKDKSKLDGLGAILGSIPDTTEVVFYENSEPDKRLTAVKELRKIAQVIEFNDMQPNEEIPFIQKVVGEKGGKIDFRSAQLLQQFVGPDLHRLQNELDKLLTYDKTITEKGIRLLVNEGYFNSIFDFTDAIGHKNARKSLTLLGKLLENGEGEPYLIAMLSSHVRNLLLVSDLASHRLSQGEIASKAKLHPYVVKKSMEQLRNFTVTELLSINRTLLDIDVAGKTGGSDPRGELEALVMNLIKK